jgi:hypothetical protein
VSHCRNVMRQSSLWLNVDREPFVVAGSPEVRSVVLSYTGPHTTASAW